jgi:taurine transport system ATP-binding protein
MADLSIEDVSMVFALPQGQGIQALKNVSLTIAQGEIVTVLGPSGCGKTTLLNVVAGFLAPSAGGVRVGDARSSARGASAAWCSSRARSSNG